MALYLAPLTGGSGSVPLGIVVNGLDRKTVMTKKDYEAMASAFGQALADIEQRANEYELTVTARHAMAEGVWLAVNAFAEVALADNPRFDGVRFGVAVRVASERVKVSA